MEINISNMSGHQHQCFTIHVQQPTVNKRETLTFNQCSEELEQSNQLESQRNNRVSPPSVSDVDKRTESLENNHASSPNDSSDSGVTKGVVSQETNCASSPTDLDVNKRTESQENNASPPIYSGVNKGTESQQTNSTYSLSDSDLTQRTESQQNRGASSTDISLSLNSRWSYVVILCSFLVTVLTLGFKTSLGVFYTEWEYYFNVSKTQVSWVTSLSPMVIGITSLFATGTAHVFGTRLPVVFGGIVTSSALLGSCFAENIVHLTISLGIISAIGMGFAFAPSIAILQHYFKKRYHVAIGIAIAGYSFGDLIFPLILQPMIGEYGWKGALFIMSALELNLVACGCVMKLPGRTNEVTSSSVKTKSDVYDIKNLETTIEESYFGDGYDNEKSHEFQTRSDIVQFLQATESGNSNAIINEGYFDDEHVIPADASRDGNIVAKSTDTPQHKNDVLLNLPNGILFSRQRSKLMQRQASKFMRDFKQEGYNLLRPLRSPIFLLMLLVMLLHGIGWYAVIGNLVPFAIAHEVPDIQAAELLTFIGVGSLVGCLSQGWIIDKTIVTSTCAKTSSLVALTIITIWYPFSYNCYPSMVTLSVFYGLAAGVSLSLFFALVRHQLPPVDAGAGVSLVIVAEMLGDTIGGVLAGFLNDTFDNFTASFYFAGLAIALATILQLFISFFKRRRKHTDHKSCRDISSKASNEIDNEESFVTQDTSGKSDPTVFVIEIRETKS